MIQSQGPLRALILAVAVISCMPRSGRAEAVRLVPRPLAAPAVCEPKSRLVPIQNRYTTLTGTASEIQSLLRSIASAPRDKSLSPDEKGRWVAIVARVAQGLEGLRTEGLYQDPASKEVLSALTGIQSMLQESPPVLRASALSAGSRQLTLSLTALEGRIDAFRAEHWQGSVRDLQALNIRCSYEEFLSGRCQDALDEICTSERRLRALGGASAVAGGGVSWESTLLSGLADFMVDRANQELVLWLISMFQSRLCEDALEWFPQTCRLLKLSDSYSQSYGALLSSALRADLEGLPIAGFKALLGIGRNLPSLIAALSLQDLEETRRRAERLWLAGKPVVKSGCGPGLLLNESSQQQRQRAAGCAQLAISGVLILAAEAASSLDGAEWEPQRACAAVRRWLERGKDSSGSSFGSVLGQSAAGLKQLIAEVQSKDACVSLGAGSQLASTLDLSRQLREFSREKRDRPEVLVAKALTLLARLGELLRGKDAIGEPEEIKQLNRAVARISAVAHAADGVYGLLLGVRKGEPPLELLASLGVSLPPLLKNTDLCQPHSAGAPSFACVLAATGSLIGRLSGVLTALSRTGVSDSGEVQLVWEDRAVCQALRDLAHEKALADSVREVLPVRDGAAIPLLVFMDRVGQLKCGDGPAADGAPLLQLPEGYLQVRALVRSVFALEQKLAQWQKSPAGAPSGVAAESLRLLAGVLESAAVVLGQEDQAEVHNLLVVMRATGDTLRGSYADGIRALLTLLGSGSGAYLPEGFRRYAMLIGDLASARDPKDVAAALSTAAAPVGSWRIKRQGRLSISISALLGVQAGGELVPLWADQGGSLRHGFAVGPMAALGVDLSGPIGGHWTLGLFGTVLDVGTLAWARLSGTGTSEEAAAPGVGVQTGAKVASEIGVLNVLSPGLYLKLGAGRSPFAFGAGFSYAPLLRTYFFRDARGQDQVDIASLFRVGAFLAVDLTLLPIFSG